MSLFSRLLQRRAPGAIKTVSPRAQPRTSSPAESPHSVVPSGDSDSDGTASPRSPPANATPPRRRGGLDIRSQLPVVDSPSSLHTSRSSSDSGSSRSTDEDISHYYQGLTVLHRGRQATIYRARCRKSGCAVIVKAYSKGAGMTVAKRDVIEKERQLLRQLGGSKSVVKLEKYIENEDNVYLVQEACTGGTLMEVIASQGGKLTEDYTALSIAAPLLTGVQYLHSRGVAHRDLKPEHVLKLGSMIKLTDLAHAARAKHEAMNARVGSLEYMAPEMLSKPTSMDIFHEVLMMGMSEEELPCYDDKVDIWSLGVILYECLTGCQPFWADNHTSMMMLQEQQLSKRDASGIPEFIARHSLSAECKDFLCKALTVDPAARPSASSLLAHKWIINRKEAVHTARPLHHSAHPESGLKRSITVDMTLPPGESDDSTGSISPISCNRSKVSRLDAVSVPIAAAATVVS